MSRSTASPPRTLPGRWTYDEAVRHILSFVNYEAAGASRLPPRNASDLERFRRALGKLGHPERDAPAAHVVGTNGKGSIAAILRALLTAHGLRTGLYTSPHLIDMRERVQIDGRPISRSDFARAARRAADVVAAAPGSGFRTTFELLTALAFSAFAGRRVGAMVVEAGMGGTLDATNVLDPKVVAVASISLDHTEVLGPTVARIAADKSGVFRRRVPVISAPQEPAAARELERRAARLSAPIEFVGREVVVEDASPTLTGERVTIRTPLARYPDLALALQGSHQAINAAVALRAAEQFLGTAVDHRLAALAFRSVRWPARFQVLSRKPLLILDGAHNPGGAAALAATLRRNFPDRDLFLILGLSEGKDHAGVLAPLLPIASRVWVTRAGHARAADPAGLARLARSLGDRPVETAPALERALKQARALAGRSGVVAVAGSLYLAGDLLRLWPRMRAGWPGTASAAGPATAARPGAGRDRSRAKKRGRPDGRPRIGKL